MKQIRLREGQLAAPLAFVLNLVLMYGVYALCRALFLWENWDAYALHIHQLDWREALTGAWMFDTSAISYSLALYALLLLLPVPWKHHRAWQMVAKGYYMLAVVVSVVTNLSDAVYFKYTGRRTTLSVVHEFRNDNNLLTIIGKELWNHAYLFVAGLLIIYIVWRLYVRPKEGVARSWRYYLTHGLSLLVVAGLSVAGMRGGFTGEIRPIALSNANQYVNHPAEAVLILNTPFAMMRTATKKAFVDPQYMSEQEMEALFSPIHRPKSKGPLRKKNVVVLILESFGAENSGWLNPTLEGGRYRGRTPFLDSLMQHSLTFEHSYANGRQSIDGMPSVLSSIPMLVEPFFVTPAALNKLSGLAGELRPMGYHTAFFHGAINGSMGFMAFARATGFSHYYGRENYAADPRFGGDADYDGTWAIWDAQFLQYFSAKMSEMPQPFCTALFTATSHHPYAVPKHLEAKYPHEGGNPLNRCVRYSDDALRQFFAIARQQPWFKNTIFVLTADHTSLSDHPEYQTSIGRFAVPIVFYDPSGELPAERRPGIAMQIDIMPTVLGYLGYDRPYVAFGRNLLEQADGWSVAYLNNSYLTTEGNLLLIFDGQRTTAVYDIAADPLCQKNLLGQRPQQAPMERRLKAFIQSYMQRMTRNQLVVNP